MNDSIMPVGPKQSRQSTYKFHRGYRHPFRLVREFSPFDSCKYKSNKTFSKLFYEQIYLNGHQQCPSTVPLGNITNFYFSLRKDAK